MNAYTPPPGWTEPDSKGHIQFTLVAPPTMWDIAPDREGYEPFFVAMTDRYTRWTYRPVVKPQPMLQLRISGIGPDDGVVSGPYSNVELFMGGSVISVQRPGEEDWTDLHPWADADVRHVFIEVAGTEPGGVA